MTNARGGSPRYAWPFAARAPLLLCVGLFAALAGAAEPGSVPSAKPDTPAAADKSGPLVPGPQNADESARPTLDLETLEKRLRETNAIGVFTKLTLKNQVEDLLDRFRALYAGRLDVPLAELRQPYELLLMKTITVVQDGDPSLAEAIAASRDAIWEMLADRDKFAALDGGI